MLRISAVVFGVALMLAACAGENYEAENLAAVRELLESPELTEEAVSSETYCTRDSCWFGDDGTLTIIDVRVESEPGEVVAALEGVAGWSFEEIDCSGDADCEAERVWIGTHPDGTLIRIAIGADRSGQILVDIRQ